MPQPSRQVSDHAYSTLPKGFVLPTAFVLTAGLGEKKQQRVTLHCGMNQDDRKQKNNAALRREGGTSCAGFSRFITSPAGATGLRPDAPLRLAPITR
jgi:hypothetical protein